MSAYVMVQPLSALDGGFQEALLSTMTYHAHVTTPSQPLTPATSRVGLSLHQIMYKYHDDK